jgi:hypothetical protein
MTLRTAVCCALLPLAVSAAASTEAAPEPALRAAAEQALWPADIVRAADRYLAAHPGSPAAAEIAASRERAAAAAEVVARRDLAIYRTAFLPTDAGQAGELRRAALGDREAALRLARAAAGTEPRRIGWLQYAAALGHDGASYELALHYRRTGQPLLAARYEAHALALGWRPAASLDHVRK